MEAPADCHIAAKVGPAERTFRPLMSAGERMQALFDAIAPASQASESTITPALSIFALISFMNSELFTRAARSWLRTRPGISVAPNARTLPLAYAPGPRAGHSPIGERISAVTRSSLFTPITP